MKRYSRNTVNQHDTPAAFRRLCVETSGGGGSAGGGGPAAFRRLCVETRNTLVVGGQEGFQPPSGGCVLKHDLVSHLQSADQPAAFRRLCVETSHIILNVLNLATSRLQAAVC